MELHSIKLASSMGDADGLSEHSHHQQEEDQERLGGPKHGGSRPKAHGVSPGHGAR